MSYTTVQKGVDTDGNVQAVGAVQNNTTAMRTLGQEDHNLSEILNELKIIRTHLELLTEAKFDGDFIEK
jgi:hypothetical protein